MCTTLLIASAVVGAMGAYKQAAAAKSAAKYQESVARNNAIISAQNASDVSQRGKIAVDQTRRKVSQALGATRTAIAGQGLLVDDDLGTTPQGLIDDMIIAGELDVMSVKHNVELEERRALLQGAEFTQQADLYGAQASSISPGLAFATSAAKSAPQIYDLIS